MSIWSTIQDWFTKEEAYVFDEEKKKREEDALFAELDKLESDLDRQDELDREIAHENAMPIEERYEYVDVDKTSDDDIKNSVNDKHAVEDKLAEEAIEKTYANKLEKENAKKAELAEEAARLEREVNIDKLEKAEKVKNNAIKSGLLESSLVGAKAEELDSLANAEIEELSKEKSDKVSKIDTELEYLTEMRAQAKDKHDNAMKDKITGEIAKLTKERDSLVAKQTRQNNKMDYKKARYEQAKINAEDRFERSWANILANRDTNEADKGYQGVRRNNYNKRVDLAKAYYEQYPTEIALQMIVDNEKLKELLGYDLHLLQHYIRVRD